MKLSEKVFSNSKLFIGLYVLVAIVVSLQSYFVGSKSIDSSGIVYTHYNNFIIFKQSFFHLVQLNDLYTHYPLEHWDLYKYSPFFALFFGIFSFLPASLGLILWNVVNSLLLAISINFLPGISQRNKSFILLICIIELTTSMQNSQSNAMMAALIILAFGFMERNKIWPAALCIVFSAFIKIFGILALCLFLFYPQKWKAAIATALSVILFLIFPIVVTGVDRLVFLYKSWWVLLSNDHASSLGYSVMGWMESWFNLHFDKIYIVITGFILFSIAFLRIKFYQYYKFRLLYLSSVLLWIVIFNHKAESPTFIIAMAGLAISFFMHISLKKIDLILLILSFVFVSLSATDLFPAFIRKEIFQPYVIKVVPCIFIWFRLVFMQVKVQKL